MRLKSFWLNNLGGKAEKGMLNYSDGNCAKQHSRDFFAGGSGSRAG